MKDKSDILKYIAAIIGCVLGALFASGNSVNSLNFGLGLYILI